MINIYKNKYFLIFLNVFLKENFSVLFLKDSIFKKDIFLVGFLNYLVCFLKYIFFNLFFGRFFKVFF